VVEDLDIPAIRPVEADADTRGVSGARVGVERLVHGPAVVGLPGVVAALEEDVGWAVVFDDEDEITLPVGFLALGSWVPVRQGGEPAQIDAAGPVGWDGERGAGLPPAFPQPLRAEFGNGLFFA
jgi:hypothetical protein